MNLSEVHELIIREEATILPCPFCNRIPKMDIRIDTWEDCYAHFIIRKGCCYVTSLGKIEVFFHATKSYRTLYNLVCLSIRKWNHRV